MIARKYRYLIALAREKHFGRAAAACHISPSTLSAAIRDLEEELGVSIVERGQQFSGLTAQGQCVVEYAQRMAAQSDGLRQALTQLGDGLSGHLRLGVIPTALTMVSALTGAFTDRHRGVTVEVLSLSTGQIIDRLRHFELEGGILYAETAHQGGLEAVPLWCENHVLVVAERRFREGEPRPPSLSWEEASRLPLALLTPDMQNRKIIDRVFQGLDCQPQPQLETNSVISLLAHVCTGRWCAILPRSVFDTIGLPQGLALVPLRAPEVAWATCLVVSAQLPRTPLAQALYEEALMLRSQIANTPSD